jgi:hypothetical protein
MERGFDMTDGDKIWLAQKGQKLGPFSETEVQQWVVEEKYGADTLVWRKGMAEWQPLHTVFPKRAPSPAPTIATAAPPAVFTAEERPQSAYSSGYQEATSDSFDLQSRDSLPTPPSLHWGLVLLFSILSLGIFALVWPFIQAGWVRKIDNASNATKWLSIGVGCLVLSVVLSMANPQSTLASLMSLAYSVLMLVAYFSMAGSIRREMAAYELPVAIGGATLFFFNLLYLQGQLSWLARWKNTGSSDPKAPKAVFWLLWVPVFLFAILAAIAVPQYQHYVERAHAVQAQRGAP